MSKEKKSESGEKHKPGVDSDLVRELAKLLSETGLSEIEWRDGDLSVRVARQMSRAAIGPMESPAGALAEAPPPPRAPVSKEAHPGAVKSPMVGTVYCSPEPNSQPFVQKGDTVRQGQTVLIIEAMKTMNPIPAARSGKVVEILVENQQPVEFGQVLMLIE